MKSKNIPLVLSIWVMLLIASLEARGQAEIPVLVKPPVNAKIMMLVDDSGSMNAVIEHPEFQYNSSCASNSSLEIPSVIFKLLSGSSSPSTGHLLSPMLIELNTGFYFSGSNPGNLFTPRTFSNPNSFPLISEMTCNNSSGNTVCCPGTSGSGCPRTGINTGALFGNSSVKGSSVFQLSNLAEYGGSRVVDSSGNEYLYLDYRYNAYENGTDDWAAVWAIFDNDDDILPNRTTAYATTGGTVKFNNREVFLSQGWYRKEYLRWIFYCASSAQLDSLPGVTRIQAVKDVMTSVIDTNPTVSFGIATLNGSTFEAGVHSGSLLDQWYTPSGDGETCERGRIRKPIGTSAASLIAETATLTAKGGTPLTSTYIETLRYFAGASDSDSCTGSSSNYTSPINGQCDAHVTIMLTDGLPSGEGAKRLPNGSYPTNLDGVSNPKSSMSSCSNDDCYSSFLPDASWWAYHTDLRSSVSGIQNIVSYAIAFGVKDYPLLNRYAQTGGTGSAYTPNDSATLAATLQNIVNIVFDTPTSGAGVATLEKLYGETKVYQPVFYGDSWVGKIQVFNYDPATEALVYDFDMSELLETRNLATNPRKIIAGYDPEFDGATDQTINFTTGNAATLRPELFRFVPSSVTVGTLAAPLQDYTSDAAAVKLINYIHGIDQTGMRTRDRDADGFVDKLGDIVYSRPVEVGAKNGDYNTLSGYTEYTASVQNEPRILLAGANDGMLHAFDSLSGEELWAYIPSSQLPHLERLARLNYNTQARRSYVDGPITVEDVYRNGAWRTLAMFGLRTGGSTYTVLDITDRRNPTLVWEVSHPSIYGQSWTKPAVVIANGSGSSPASYDFYLVVGTGEGKSADGTNLAAYNLNSASPPSPTIITLNAGDPAGTRTTSVATSQNDADRAVDRLYVGTESGDVYRIKTQGAASSWTSAKLFDGSSNNPIVAQPIVVLADNPVYTSGGSGVASLPLAVGVYFGTGRHDETSDIVTVAGVSQRIYGIFDPVSTTNDTLAHVHTNLTTANLQNQSTGTFNVRRDPVSGKYLTPTGKYGFYIPLSTAVNVTASNFIEPVGEIVNPPVNVRGEILFSTFTPDTGSCDIGGLSFLQGVHFQTGGGAVVDFHQDPNAPFYNGGIADITGNGSVNSSDLTAGIAANLYEPVFDTAVTSVDLTDAVTPYDHDGELQSNDIRLHSSNGGILPALSAVGHTGLPGSPSVLLGAKKIVIPEAYPQDPGNPGSGSGGEDDPGDTGSTDQMPPPKLLPMNIFNVPVSVLSFHEVTQ